MVPQTRRWKEPDSNRWSRSWPSGPDPGRFPVSESQVRRELAAGGKADSNLRSLLEERQAERPDLIRLMLPPAANREDR